MTSTLVALNIVSGNVLMNLETKVPILFSYEGDYDTILSSLIENESFVKHVSAKCFNIYEYERAELCYFYFDSSNNEESYKENVVKIQDMFTLEMIEDSFSSFPNSSFWKDILIYHINNIYKDNFGSSFSSDNPISMDEEISKMMNGIIEKNNTTSYRTICEYVRSILINKTSLSEENISHMISHLEKLENNNN